MEFKIHFMSMENGVRKSIIAMPKVNIGMELLKKLNVASNGVRNSIIFPIERSDYFCEIPSKIAEKSGLFNETNSITIITYSNFLNSYVDIKYNKEYKELEYSVNEKKLIEDWVIDNYPVFMLNATKSQLELDAEVKSIEFKLLESNTEEEILEIECKEFEEKQLILRLREIQLEKELLSLKINKSKQAFRKLAKQCHPDQGGSGDDFVNLMKIYKENQ